MGVGVGMGVGIGVGVGEGEGELLLRTLLNSLTAIFQCFFLEGGVARLQL